MFTSLLLRIQEANMIKEFNGGVMVVSGGGGGGGGI